MWGGEGECPNIMDITLQFASLIPIAVALVEVAKRTGLPTRFAPLLAVVLGLLGTVALGHFDIINGVVVGLSAAGLYSGVKTTLN